jgi:hypothetical protein
MGGSAITRSLPMHRRWSLNRTENSKPRKMHQLRDVNGNYQDVQGSQHRAVVRKTVIAGLLPAMALQSS